MNLDYMQLLVLLLVALLLGKQTLWPIMARYLEKALGVKVNGRGDSGRIEHLEQQLRLLTENHAAHIQDDLTSLHAKVDKQAEALFKISFYLEEIHKNGIKCIM